jgi:hypothetical protein
MKTQLSFSLQLPEDPDHIEWSTVLVTYNYNSHDAIHSMHHIPRVGEFVYLDEYMDSPHPIIPCAQLTVAEVSWSFGIDYCDIEIYLRECGRCPVSWKAQVNERLRGRPLTSFGAAGVAYRTARQETR